MVGVAVRRVGPRRGGDELRAQEDRRSGSEKHTRGQPLRGPVLVEIAALTSEPQSRVLALIQETPSLVDYAEKMWFRHEDALVAVITEEFGLTEPSDEIRFYLRFALNIQLVATREADPEPTIDRGLRLLDEGWALYARNGG